MEYLCFSERMSTIMKKILSLIMALAVSASMSTAVFAETATPKIKVDGRAITFREEQKPMIKDDRLYVPIRRVLETMGARVIWNGDERSITVKSFDNINEVRMVIDSKQITSLEYTSVLFANTEEITSDVAPIIVNDRTMLPIRVVAEAMDATVYYDEATKITHITTKQAKRAANKANIDTNAKDLILEDLYKENLPKVSIESDAENIKEGDAVRVKIKLSDIEKYTKDAKLSSITATIAYNSENFEYSEFNWVINGEEKMPMLYADNAHFTEETMKFVTLELPENAVAMEGDGVIAVVTFKALNDKGGEFVLSDGISDVGYDTEIGFAEGKGLDTLSKYTELYIDTTPIMVK